MTGHRLERLLDDGELEEVEPDSGAVVGFWKKAAEDWGVAEKPGVPPSVSLRLLYTAGFKIATAILRASGYRVRGTSQHFNTFYALRGLEDARLDDLGAAMDGFRSLRHAVLYEPESPIDPSHVEELRGTVTRLFAAGRDVIVERLPDSAEHLEPPV